MEEFTKFITPAGLFRAESDKRFAPEKPEKKYDLFWHTKEFLENNTNDEVITKITNEDGYQPNNQFRINRLKKIKEYLNLVVYVEFDRKVQTLWRNDPQRDEIIAKAEQLLVRSQYNMGYAQSGLYLDYNKFFDVLDNKTPAKEALRIFDNNLFLGNMATFYTTFVQEGENKALIKQAKENYKQTLQLMGSEQKHFKLPYEEKKYFKYVNDKIKVLSKNECDNETYVASGPQVLSEFIVFKDREHKQDERQVYKKELYSLEQNYEKSIKNDFQI